MAEKTYSFSLPERILIASFWWLFLSAIILILPFLRIFWWILIPLMLSVELRKLYFWWIRWDYAYSKIEWKVLEIVPPKEVLVPLKAMEDVFSVIWPTLWDSPNFRESWADGILNDAPGWMSLEIVSIEGNLHFYIRINKDHRSMLESALYAHYPELEIHEVPDYVNNVPYNIPNEEWNAYGEDFILGKESAYPIKTYEKFFEPQGEKISAEEKRIDPMASLLESMSKLGPGEQFWLQFIIMSVNDKDEPEWRKEGERIISKVAKRPVKKVKTISEGLSQIGYDLIFGPKQEGETYKWVESAKTEEGERELLVTPGEREVITEIENKLKKPVFRVNITGFYVAKRENFKMANRILTRSYFAHFMTSNLNFIRFSTITRPKTKYFFRKQVPFIRTRRMFKNYVLRFPTLFPNRKRECAILNTEEMATLFHFPIKIAGMVAPTMSSIQSKKSGPPPNLPIE